MRLGGAAQLEDLIKGWNTLRIVAGANGSTV